AWRANEIGVCRREGLDAIVGRAGVHTRKGLSSRPLPDVRPVQIEVILEPIRAEVRIDNIRCLRGALRIQITPSRTIRNQIGGIPLLPAAGQTDAHHPPYSFPPRSSLSHHLLPT